MIASELKLKENLEEELVRPVAAFPHTIFYDDIARHPGGYVPWHWHPDVEVIWAMQGGIRLGTSSHSFSVHTGEGVFINSNVLHYKEPLPGPDAILLTHVFDVQLLSGGHKSIFEQKYITPIVECKELEAMAFHPSVPNQRKILELIHRAYDVADEGGYGYEFEVRNSLSTMWWLLCKEAEPVLRSKKVVVNQNEERIKKMLLFIRENYQERISLEQIASAASISTRECLRCFGQNLNMTPFTYLLEYRIRRAAGELRESNKPITDIAYDCGFSGTSYFSKTFRKIMECTPSKYRSLYRNSKTGDGEESGAKEKENGDRNGKEDIDKENNDRT